MTRNTIIDALRISAGVADPDLGQNSAYLSLTDAELEVILEIALDRVNPGTSLDNVEEGYLYPLIMVAKIELFNILALKYARKFDLGADNNNYLKQSQIFDHFKALADAAEKAYNDYLDSEDAVGHNTLTSFDVLLSSRYYTRRNYQLGVIPTVSLSVDDLTDTYVELSWKIGKIEQFHHYTLWISDSPLYDPYRIPVVERLPRPLVIFHNKHRMKARINNLDFTTYPNYHILIGVTNTSCLTGYHEIVLEKPPVDEEGEGLCEIIDLSSNIGGGNSG